MEVGNIIPWKLTLFLLQVSNSRFGNQRSTSTERKVFSDTYKKICLSSQKGVPLPLHVGEIERNQSGKQTSVPSEAVQSTTLPVCKPSLPFTEWNIDSSELRIGVRVGIGMYSVILMSEINIRAKYRNKCRC
jgi:hypothetical protein